MIKWIYESMDVFSFWFEIQDEYGQPIYKGSIISSPAMSLLKEILSDYQFAKDINNTEKIFDYDDLSPEDKMDLKLITIHKLEDADNES